MYDECMSVGYCACDTSDCEPYKAGAKCCNPDHDYYNGTLGMMWATYSNCYSDVFV